MATSLETMSTMVATPYVNHIATMTGGVGFQDLARFYKVMLGERTWSTIITMGYSSIILQAKA